MDFGKIEYICVHEDEHEHPSKKVLKLTLIGQADEDILLKQGIAALRLRRIIRLTQEADEQGCLLSYDDLETLLATSLSTLKRDIAHLEGRGFRVALKNRKKGYAPFDQEMDGLVREYQHQLLDSAKPVTKIHGNE